MDSEKKGIRSILDTVATLAVIGVAVLVAIQVLGGRSSTPSRGPRPEPALPSEPQALGANRQGSPTAKVVMLEFADFQCGVCSTFRKTLLPEIERDYVQTGKVQFAFRHFPLPNHPMARDAAQASECAATQGKFWEMSAYLFDNSTRLDKAEIFKQANSLLPKPADFETCMAAPPPALIEQDFKAGEALPVRGTPTFVFGLMLPDGRVEAKQRMSGMSTIADFRKALDALLAQANGQ